MTFNILDTTLRDGSYAINFSFTSADTALLCQKLESAGVEFIEIGHGVGLSASAKGHGKAFQTDAEYMIAANTTLSKSKWGMFCIPGIASLEDIKLAAEHGMDFIRIGTNVTEIELSKEFIKKAKDSGMTVMANFMKSYALNPEEFAKKVKLSQSYGADIVYLVDSAGGMFPEDIARYYEEIRKTSDVALGFHSHNNLGMAVANNLKAVELGFEYVDSSLQGLGRGSGNACTEAFLACLLKKGYSVDIDFIKLLDISNKYVKPLVTDNGYKILDIVSGYAEFHSSYMHHIERASTKYKINPIILIIEMCKINKVDIDINVLENIAQKIQTEEEFYIAKYNFMSYFGEEQNV